VTVIDRRELIAAAMAGGALAASANAWGKGSPEVGRLQRLIRVEQEGIAMYAGLRAGSLVELFGTLGRQDVQHEEVLAGALRQRGGRPPARLTIRDVEGLAGVRTTDQLLEFARVHEASAIGAYSEAIGRTTKGALMRIMLSTMANHGQHLCLIRRALGRDPVPNAFETGL
jgi:hypothetical protein